MQLWLRWRFIQQFNGFGGKRNWRRHHQRPHLTIHLVHIEIHSLSSTRRGWRRSAWWRTQSLDWGLSAPILGRWCYPLHMTRLLICCWLMICFFCIVSRWWLLNFWFKLDRVTSFLLIIFFHISTKETFFKKSLIYEIFFKIVFQKWYFWNSPKKLCIVWYSGYTIWHIFEKNV